MNDPRREQPSDACGQRTDAATTAAAAWRNSPSITGFRSYGGGDARIEIDGGVLRVKVRPATRFVLVFGSLFIPGFAAAAWWGIPEGPWRLLFAVGGVVIGCVTFAFIHWLMRYHERLGDYLVIDRAGGTVRLPRVKVQFPLADVVGFQWIRGRSQGRWDVDADLNLLVKERGEVVRYHVLGSPQRATAEQIVRFSGLPLTEIDLGSRGSRDDDVRTKG